MLSLLELGPRLQVWRLRSVSVAFLGFFVQVLLIEVFQILVLSVDFHFFLKNAFYAQYVHASDLVFGFYLQSNGLAVPFVFASSDHDFEKAS